MKTVNKKAISIAFIQIYQFSKLFFYSTIILKILEIIKFFSFAYISKKLIDQISFSILNKDEKATIDSIKYIVFVTLIAIIFVFTEKLLMYFTAKAHITLVVRSRAYINKKIAMMDISVFDSPECNDQLKQAIRDFGGVEALFLNYCNLFFSFLSLIISFTIVFLLQYIVAFFVIISVIPSFFLIKRLKKKNYILEKELNTTDRRIDYYSHIFGSKQYAKEMRFYNLKDFFSKKYENISSYKKKKKSKFLFLTMINECSLSFIQNIFKLFVYIFVFLKVLKENLTIGEFTYIGTIILNLSQATNSFLTSINDIIINSQKVKNFYLFLEQDYSLKLLNKSNMQNALKIKSLRFENVSFVYPNSEKYVLKNLNFEIKNNEKVAFAGVNGAGKSTIIKLILRLYKPTSGAIYLNEVNIEEIDITEYRAIFSSMFQEYTQYSLSVFDNIRISDINAKIDINRAIKALKCASLNDDLNLTSLLKEVTKSFSEDGVVYSVGQLQKLNFARTLYRQTDIYIFDEPSASLDPFSEEHIFREILKNLQDRTVILISHRLGNLKNFDKIIFLNNGEISEIGSHFGLIKKKGEYYRMYMTQFNQY